jgi:DNA polymerase-3 subunit epsilon
MLYRLCLRRLGLEGGSGPCIAHGARRCAGVCAGRESPAEHDARLAAALAGVGIKPWPWAGAVRVDEHHPASGRTRHHVFDRWCYLGSAADEATAVALAATAPRAFDADIWRILSRWLAAPAHLQQVAPLSAGEA